MTNEEKVGLRMLVMSMARTYRREPATDDKSSILTSTQEQLSPGKPKTVTREWVLDTVHRIKIAGGRYKTMTEALKELGIEVVDE